MAILEDWSSDLDLSASEGDEGAGVRSRGRRHPAAPSSAAAPAAGAAGPSSAVKRNPSRSARPLESGGKGRQFYGMEGGAAGAVASRRQGGCPPAPAPAPSPSPLLPLPAPAADANAQALAPASDLAALLAAKANMDAALIARAQADAAAARAAGAGAVGVATNAATLLAHLAAAGRPPTAAELAEVMASTTQAANALAATVAGGGGGGAPSFALSPPPAGQQTVVGGCARPQHNGPASAPAAAAAAAAAPPHTPASGRDREQGPNTAAAAAAAAAGLAWPPAPAGRAGSLPAGVEEAGQNFGPLSRYRAICRLPDSAALPAGRWPDVSTACAAVDVLALAAAAPGAPLGRPGGGTIHFDPALYGVAGFSRARLACAGPEIVSAALQWASRQMRLALYGWAAMPGKVPPRPSLAALALAGELGPLFRGIAGFRGDTPPPGLAKLAAAARHKKKNHPRPGKVGGGRQGAASPGSPPSSSDGDDLDAARPARPVPPFRDTIAEGCRWLAAIPRPPSAGRGTLRVRGGRFTSRYVCGAAADLLRLSAGLDPRNRPRAAYTAAGVDVAALRAAGVVATSDALRVASLGPGASLARTSPRGGRLAPGTAALGKRLGPLIQRIGASAAAKAAAARRARGEAGEDPAARAPPGTPRQGPLKRGGGGGAASASEEGAAAARKRRRRSASAVSSDYSDGEEDEDEDEEGEGEEVAAARQAPPAPPAPRAPPLTPRAPQAPTAQASPPRAFKHVTEVGRGAFKAVLPSAAAGGAAGGRPLEAGVFSSAALAGGAADLVALSVRPGAPPPSRSHLNRPASMYTNMQEGLLATLATAGAATVAAALASAADRAPPGAAPPGGLQGVMVGELGGRLMPVLEGVVAVESLLGVCGGRGGGSRTPAAPAAPAAPAKQAGRAEEEPDLVAGVSSADFSEEGEGRCGGREAGRRAPAARAPVRPPPPTPESRARAVPPGGGVPWAAGSYF